eukprot:920546_1
MKPWRHWMILQWKDEDSNEQAVIIHHSNRWKIQLIQMERRKRIDDKWQMVMCALNGASSDEENEPMEDAEAKESVTKPIQSLRDTYHHQTNFRLTSAPVMVGQNDTDKPTHDELEIESMDIDA